MPRADLEKLYHETPAAPRRADLAALYDDKSAAAPAPRFVFEEEAPASTTPAVPSPTRWSQKLGEGMVPGFNRLAALAQAATDPLIPGRTDEWGQSFGTRYAAHLEANQGQGQETQRAHPYAASLLQGVGAVPTMLAAPQSSAPVAGLLGRVAAGAKAAAPVGAAYAAGDAPAGATPGEVLSRAGLGAGTAAGVGAAIPVLVAAADPVAKKFQKVAIEQGRKALSGIGTPLSARKPIPEAAVQQALDTGAIRPLGTVGGTAQRLEAYAEKLGEQYAAILKELEARGVTGPDAVVLAKELQARAAEGLENSLGSSRPGMLSEAADELLAKVGAAPPKAAHGHGHGRGAPAKPEGLVDPYGRPIPSAPPAPKDTRLKLGQAEEIKRGLQAEARREYDKITRQYTTAGETKKELAATMRGAIEDAVQQQAGLAPEEAAAFEPVKAKVANALAALRVAEEGAARAARRKPISLTSTIAGSAIGAGSGNPWLGLVGALGHGVVDARLASTLARAANTGAKGANALARLPVPPSAARATAFALDPELVALLNALRGRPGFAPAAAEESDQ